MSGQGSDRVNRGGSWNNNGSNCQAANRNRNAPTNRNNNLGVRLARAPRGQRRLCRTEPAALPFRRGFLLGGQKDRGPPGVSSSANAPGGRLPFDAVEAAVTPPSASLFDLDFFEPLPIQVEVSDAPLTSDAGLLPLRQFDDASA